MSIAPPHPSSGQIRSVRLRSLRAGCDSIRDQLSNEASIHDAGVIGIALDHLNCIQQELHHAETCPMSLFEDRQCHRLSSYCREAATAIVDLPSSSTTNQAQELSLAFLGLVPRLLEDYERVLRRRLCLHCA